MSERERDLLDLIEELEGLARSGDPETSREAAWRPKRGRLAIKVLMFLTAQHPRPVTQRHCEKHYGDDKRALGPRFKQLETAGLIERACRPDGKPMRLMQEGTMRELWRLTDQGVTFMAKLAAERPGLLR